jgi:hypothetical protein
MTKAKEKMKTGGNAAMGRWPVMIRLGTYKKLKALAAKRGVTAYALAEEIMAAGLERKIKDAERRKKETKKTSSEEQAAA